MVIVAGYTQPMKDFIQSNPGLESRFNRYFDFPSYNAADLAEIFSRTVNSKGLQFDADYGEELTRYFDGEARKLGERFGNARFVRNYFEKVIQQQASRLAKKNSHEDSELRTLTRVDLLLGNHG